MKRLTSICLLFAGFPGCQASADDTSQISSGNYMLPHCEHYTADNPPLDVFDGECGGTVDTLMFFGSSLPDKFRFCPPKGASNFQAGRVVVFYLKAHPELLHLNFKGLAATGLRAAWPCK